MPSLRGLVVLAHSVTTTGPGRTTWITTSVSACSVWLSPTTARTSEPWGNYNLGRTDVEFEELPGKVLRAATQFTLPHNIMGTPAISLPLAMHSNGLPIGVQLGTRPADEHVVLQLAAALEEAMPWGERVPPLHVSRVSAP